MAKDSPEKKPEFYIPPEILVPMVEGLQRGEEAAVVEMRRLCKDYLERYFWVKMPSWDKATQRDLMENTLAIACAKISSLKTPEAFIRWLRTIAHSQLYHYYKKREAEQRRLEKELERQKQEMARNRQGSSGFSSSDPELRKKINRLPEAQRQAILLQMQGFKVREIAEKQSVSVGTVKSRLNYARMKLRQDAD
jgi:RNA polymerase sigma-70 factor (ECF subfamily)